MVTSAGRGRVNADPVKHHDYDRNEDDKVRGTRTSDVSCNANDRQGIIVIEPC